MEKTHPSNSQQTAQAIQPEVEQEIPRLLLAPGFARGGRVKAIYDSIAQSTHVNI